MGFCLQPRKTAPKPCRIGLLLDATSFRDESGDRVSLKSIPEDTRVFASVDHIRHLIIEGQGEALCWDGGPIRWKPGKSEGRDWPLRNSDIRILRLPFPDSEETLRGLIHWREWLWEHGVSPKSSVGSTSMALLRSTLRGPLFLNVPQPGHSVPPIPTLVGGRQVGDGKPRHIVGSIAHYDLPAAYTEVLGYMHYGGGWIEQRRETPGTWKDSGSLQFAEAEVTIPELPFFGPLPERPDPKYSPRFISGLIGSVFPYSTTIRGIWAMPELRIAREAGCTVRLDRVWLQRWDDRYPMPFLSWFRIIQEGRRELRGFARQLAKITGNSLWGQFAINPHGRKSIKSYEDRGGRLKHSSRKVPHRSAPRALDIAEYLTGTIRASLYGLMVEAGSRLICAHTDGGWVVEDGEPLGLPSGWRKKVQTTELRYLGPQNLSYKVKRKWEYVAAQWPREIVVEQFESEWRRAVT